MKHSIKLSQYWQTFTSMLTTQINCFFKNSKSLHTGECNKVWNWDCLYLRLLKRVAVKYDTRMSPFYKWATTPFVQHFTASPCQSLWTVQSLLTKPCNQITTKRKFSRFHLAFFWYNNKVLNKEKSHIW